MTMTTTMSTLSHNFGCCRHQHHKFIITITGPVHPQVFYRGFHMHGIGQRMVTRQYRRGGGGAVLVRTDSVEFWNFNMQVAGA